MDLHRCLQTFTVVVDQGSFNQAAKQLYRSASQISKEISWLEGHLNTSLINRTTRALHITDAGRHCYHTAKKLLSDVDSLKLSLNQQQECIAGPLRISLPVGFGQRCLISCITAFIKQHPEIQLTADFSNHVVDMVRDDIDITIRNTKADSGTLVSQSLYARKRCVYAAPDYLKKMGTPQSPDDLVRHKLIAHTDLLGPVRWRFSHNKDTMVTKPNYISNSIESMIDAAVNGLGCVYLPSYHIDQSLIKHNKLIEILKPYQQKPVTLYICYLKKPFIEKRITAFVEAAIKHCSQLSF